MAQIKLNSKVVAEACDKEIGYLLKKGLSALSEEVELVESIRELAEFEEKRMQQVWIDHNDYQLLKEYL